jgi:hypothetical protein
MAVWSSDGYPFVGMGLQKGYRIFLAQIGFAANIKVQVT